MFRFISDSGSRLQLTASLVRPLMFSPTVLTPAAENVLLPGMVGGIVSRLNWLIPGFGIWQAEWLKSLMTVSLWRERWISSAKAVSPPVDRLSFSVSSGRPFHGRRMTGLGDWPNTQ
jgi:hypothetical protein